MSNIKKRIERAEAATQALAKDTEDRKAKLLELERLRENGDRLAAFELAAELQYGPNWNLGQVMADLARRKAAERQQ